MKSASLTEEYQRLRRKSISNKNKSNQMHYMGYDDDDVEKNWMLDSSLKFVNRLSLHVKSAHLDLAQKVLHGCPQASVLTLLGIFCSPVQEPPSWLTGSTLCSSVPLNALFFCPGHFTPSDKSSRISVSYNSSCRHVDRR